MLPVVFRIPWIELDIPGYGLMLTIGFLVAIVWAARRALRSKGNPDIILNCGFIALIGGIVGARLMYVVHYWEQFKDRGGIIEILWAILDVTRGGLEYYGGFLLATVGVLGYLFLWKHSLRWYLDIVAPSAAIGLAFGRLGCFLNGCCYGAVCEQPWSVQFPYASSAAVEQWRAKMPGAELRKELLWEVDRIGLMLPLSRESLAATDEQIAAAQRAEEKARAARDQARAARDAATPDQKGDLENKLRRAQRDYELSRVKFVDIRTNMERYGVTAAQIRGWASVSPSLPVHPTQIYSFFVATTLALLLNSIYWRRARDGIVISLLLILEPAARFLLEVIRDDNPLDVYGLTISQSIALGLMAAGVLALLVNMALPARSPLAREFVPELADEQPKGTVKPATR